MDTKPPPIPQKPHERPQLKKQERTADVSLPPLTPLPNHRQRLKTPGTSWARESPYVHQSHSYQTGRPYRVLHIGATPLMHACQQADRSRVLRLLKDQEYTVGFRDRTLRNALHYCMDSGTGGAVATAAPELVNAPDAEGHTPLHLAVIAGDAQLVAVLLANGANVNAKDLEGHSVLHWATVCGEAECVRLVLSAGARPSTPDLRGGSPLHYAAQCCGAAATAELAVPKKVGLKVLQTLLEFGGNVNAKDEDGRQPILWAASAGSVEAVLALARAGGSAAAGASDKDGLTALHCAASRGHARCVEALVNLCGSQPDHVDDNGCSALHYAATLGHADATALLLRLGADPNRQDRKGRTPALCAAAKGQLETLKLLAQHGGSLHARTVRGTGVAHEAASSGRVELIKWLAKKRPSTLDVATHDGRTPLHVAALHGHVDACKVLLDHGARFNATLRTSKGNLMTALDAALYRGHRDCAKLIQMHGGTTAQQLRAQKTAPNKVFGAKLRVKQVDTSSDSEMSTPRRRRRRRSIRTPDVYYEEHWEERRTRRRGSLRKADRRGSRSYSDEEFRPSKRSRDRERRTRSESARYESERDRRGRRKRSRRHSKRNKHEYSESTTESESQSSSEDEILKQKEARGSKGEAAVDDERNKSQRSEDEEDSVSDDSLEVVIVKKSVERKSEKVVSGRKSKTPRDAVKSNASETVTCAKSKTRKRSSRKKSKDKTLKTKAKTCADVRDDQAEQTEMDARASRMKDSLRRNGDATTDTDQALQGEADHSDVLDAEQKVHYRNDVTDSTSQEAVERVTVQAMVHKDQAPDTSDEISPKNSREEESGKEKLNSVGAKEAEEPQKRMRPRSARPGSSRPRGVSAKSKMDHILEKADEMQSALMQKAADLKKGMEEMRQNAPEEVKETGEKRAEKKSEKIDDYKDKVEGGIVNREKNEEKSDLEGSEEADDVVMGGDDRQAEDEANESETPSEDSQKGSSMLQNQSEVGSGSKDGKENTSQSPGSSKNPGNDKSAADEEPVVEKSSSIQPAENLLSRSPDKATSPKKQRNRRKTKNEGDTTPRTVVQDIPPSGSEDKSIDNSQGCESPTKSSKSKSRTSTARDKSSSNSRRSTSPKKSPESGVKKRTKRSGSDSFAAGEAVQSKTEKTALEKKPSESSENQTSADRTTGSLEKETAGSSPNDGKTESLEKDASERSPDSVSKRASDRKKSNDRSCDVRTTKASKKKTSGISDDRTSESFEDSPDRSTDNRKKDVQKSISITEEGRLNEDDNLEVNELPSAKDSTEELENLTDDRLLASPKKAPLSLGEDFRFIDDSATERKSSGSSPSPRKKHSRPSTAKNRGIGTPSSSKLNLMDSSEECSPDRSAIVAVIESPEWEEDEEDDEIDKEIQEAIGDDVEQDTEPEDNSMGVMRVLPSTSEDETPRTVGLSRTSGIDSLPQVHPKPRPRLLRTQSPQENRRGRPRTRQRRDSGGRDSGIEPSPRISRIPKRTTKCYPNTEKQQALNMETVTRDVQINLRRYHLERKIFFQLMELKRLQIRHGKTNEHVLVKRQVEAFHKAGAAGPILGVAKYEQPLTFRHFEAFLYEQLRRLQKRPATPEWCAEAKQCTQKTHRCHHATSAYTSVPVYTYLGGLPDRGGSLLPKIHGRGRGQMTMEVSHGEEKQVIALPAEKLDRGKRYFVTFTVRGDNQETEQPKPPSQEAQRPTKSV